MKWLKNLLWRIRNPLSFKGREETIQEFEEGKKKAEPYKEEETKYNKSIKEEV